MMPLHYFGVTCPQSRPGRERYKRTTVRCTRCWLRDHRPHRGLDLVSIATHAPTSVRFACCSSSAWASSPRAGVFETFRALEIAECLIDPL